MYIYDKGIGMLYIYTLVSMYFVSNLYTINGHIRITYGFIKDIDYTYPILHFIYLIMEGEMYS